MKTRLKTSIKNTQESEIKIKKIIKSGIIFGNKNPYIKRTIISEVDKESILKNINLRNNQNYIFGKNEKRKVSTKYFIEKISDKIFLFLSFLNSLLYNLKYNYSIGGGNINILFIFLILLYSLSSIIIYGEISQVLILIIIIVPISIIFILLINKKL